MRISDWSSDVCSSDLRATDRGAHAVARLAHRRLRQAAHVPPRQAAGEVDLDPDLGGVDSLARTSVHARKRPVSRPSAAAVLPASPQAVPTAAPQAAPAPPASPPCPPPHPPAPR